MHGSIVTGLTGLTRFFFKPHTDFTDLTDNISRQDAKNAKNSVAICGLRGSKKIIGICGQQNPAEFRLHSGDYNNIRDIRGIRAPKFFASFATLRETIFFRESPEERRAA